MADGPAAEAADGAARGAALERAYVHEVYESARAQEEAPRPDARAHAFLTELEPGSLVCDVGCGSGQYLSVNPSVFSLGGDRCSRLAAQAHQQDNEDNEVSHLLLPGAQNCVRSDSSGQHLSVNPSVFSLGGDRCSRLAAQAHQQDNEVVVCDNLALPFRDDSFDAVVSVAVVHHFATVERRAHALRELARVTRLGGRLLLTVWAMEHEGRDFHSQDVLIPWHAAGSPPPPPPRADPPRPRPFLSVDNERCGEEWRWRTRGGSGGGGGDSSPGSSSLSSPSETCYSFVRRALQRLAGRRSFLHSWSFSRAPLPGGGAPLERDDTRDARDLPIELRTADIEPPPPPPPPPRSRSLTDVGDLERRGLARSRSSLPGLGSRAASPERAPPPAERAPPPPEPRPRPPLVKQKKSINEEDADEALDEPTDMRGLVSEMPDFEIHARRLERRPGVFKQSSLNEELMSAERLRERERLRRNIQKQASLNEEDLLRRHGTLDSLRDSIFSTSATTAKKFQSLKNGLTNKLKTSTTGMEKVTVIGFVKMFQGWRGAEWGAPPPEPPPGEAQARAAAAASSGAADGGRERRHSREDGSDSSKDSSLQSDTSVDSEDSFASVIFVPRADGSSQEPASPTPLSPGPTSPRLKVCSLPTSPRMKSAPALPSPRLKQFPTARPPPSPKASQAPVQLNRILLAQYGIRSHSAEARSQPDSPPASRPSEPPPPAATLPAEPPDDGAAAAPVREETSSPERSSEELMAEINRDIEEIRKLTAETERLKPRVLQDAKPHPKITLQTVAELPEIPQWRGRRESEPDAARALAADRKRKERVRQVREMLRQGVPAANHRSFPLVRRDGAGARPPRLASLELFNPETDDADSDSSGVSSPDSVDSVISVLPDELRRVALEKGKHIFNPETDDADSDSSGVSSPDSVDSVISVLPDELRRVALEKGKHIFNPETDDADSDSSGVSSLELFNPETDDADSDSRGVSSPDSVDSVISVLPDELRRVALEKGKHIFNPETDDADSDYSGVSSPDSVDSVISVLPDELRRVALEKGKHIFNPETDDADSDSSGVSSLELFNPETDDADSDSSGVSSPDSVDSVISVLPDELRRVALEKGKHIFNPETDDADSDSSGISSPDSVDSVISVLPDELRRVALEKGEYIFNPETKDADSNSSGVSSPDSVDSVISVLPDELRRVALEKGKHIFNPETDDADSDSSGVSSPDSVDSVINVLSDELRRVALEKDTLDPAVSKREEEEKAPQKDKTSSTSTQNLLEAAAAAEVAQSPEETCDTVVQSSPSRPRRRLDNVDAAATAAGASGSSSGSTWSLNKLSPSELRLLEERSRSHTSSSGSSSSLERLSPGRRSKERSPRQGSTSNSTWSLNRLSPAGRPDAASLDALLHRSPTRFPSDSLSVSSTDSDKSISKSDSFGRLQANERLVTCKSDVVGKDEEREWNDECRQHLTEFAEKLSEKLLHEIDQYSRRINDEDFDLPSSSGSEASVSLRLRREKEARHTQKVLDDLSDGLQRLDDPSITRISSEIQDLTKLSQEIYERNRQLTCATDGAEDATELFPKCGVSTKTKKILAKYREARRSARASEEDAILNNVPGAQPEADTILEEADESASNGNPEITVDSGAFELSRSLDTGCSIESEMSVDSFCTDKRSSLRVGHSTDSSDLDKMEISPESLASRSSAAPLRSHFSVESSDTSASDWSRRDRTASTASLPPAAGRIAAHAPLQSSLSDASGDSACSEGGGGGAGVLHRYYHVFRQGELDNLIDKYVENLHVVSSYYDHSSWCVVAEKVQVWTI